jgi:hypothetical protein
MIIDNSELVQGKGRKLYQKAFNKGRKDTFIALWKGLPEKCKK